MADTDGIHYFICAQCGKNAARPYRGSGVRPTLCSSACKTAAWRGRNPDYNKANREREAISRRLRPHVVVKMPLEVKHCQECGCRFHGAGLVCGDECRKAKACRVIREASAAKHSKEERCCAECGKVFTPQYGDNLRKFCSRDCSKRSVKRTYRKRKRATLKAATVESVNPTMVFERDGWKCQICFVKTPRRLRGSCEPRAPELDHIIPLAHGGEHSYRNTQCLCRACNAAKSDGVGGQLRLFG